MKAMGGDLRLIAEFPNRKPVVLKGIAEAEARPEPTRGKHNLPGQKKAVPRR